MNYSRRYLKAIEKIKPYQLSVSLCGCSVLPDEMHVQNPQSW